jgi:drug/metabolite transporter (DMT)-like permease
VPGELSCLVLDARPSSTPPSEPRITAAVRGVLWMVVASAFFAMMGAAGKAASRELPAIEVAFFRSFLSLLAIAAMARGLGWNLRVTDRPRMALRGLAGTASLISYFWSLSIMPLAEAILLANTSPIFTALLAWWLLGEKPTLRSAGGLAVATLGVAVLVRPGSEFFGPGAAIALFGAACAGLAYTQVRTLRDEPTWGIVFWFMLIASLTTSLAMVPIFEVPRPPEVWWALAGAALAATAAQGAMTLSYSLAPASTASVASLCTVLIAAVFGALLFGEIPGPATAIGGAFILGGTWLAATGVSRDPAVNGEIA